MNLRVTAFFAGLSATTQACTTDPRGYSGKGFVEAGISIDEAVAFAHGTALFSNEVIRFGPEFDGDVCAIGARKFIDNFNGEPQDAGPSVDLTGPAATLSLPRDLGLYTATAGEQFPWTTGTRIIVESDGGPDVGPFSEPIDLPGGVMLTAAQRQQIPTTLQEPNDLVLTWTSFGKTEPVFVTISGSGSKSLTCKFKDDGLAVIPYSYLDAALCGSCGGSPNSHSVTFSKQNTRNAHVPGYGSVFVRTFIETKVRVYVAPEVGDGYLP